MEPAPDTFTDTLSGEFPRDTFTDTASGELALDAFSDDELGELALAAGPVDQPDADAIPLGQYLGQGALPSWYMPAPMASARRQPGRRKAIVVSLIVGFLFIDGLGLCFTYGPLVVA